MREVADVIVIFSSEKCSGRTTGWWWWLFDGWVVDKLFSRERIRSEIRAPGFSWAFVLPAVAPPPRPPLPPPRDVGELILILTAERDAKILVVCDFPRAFGLSHDA